MNAISKNPVIKAFNSKIESAHERIRKLAEHLSADPAYALSWSTDSFSAAAKIKVFSAVLKFMEKKAEPEVQKYCSTRAQEMAKNPSFSTSPASNLMSMMEASAWAEAAEILEQYSI